jgi:L-ribulose-5-phosphate 3-epimerase
MKLSFITANYVARELEFNMTEGWMQGDTAANNHYRPIETYATRINELFGLIAAQGYSYVDIWTAHLHWSWATAEHIALAKAAAQRHALTPLCYGGGFGSTEAEFSKACYTAHAMGIQILAGSTPLLAQNRMAVAAILAEHDCYLAIENHPKEKTPADILAQIGDGCNGRIGTAIDTGWWGTQGYDAADAIDELYPHILAVHLKDVRAAGGHETCRFGQGVVPITRCIQLLKQRGYQGPLAIEHEPDTFDPTEDCVAMRQMVRYELGLS